MYMYRVTTMMSITVWHSMTEYGTEYNNVTKYDNVAQNTTWQKRDNVTLNMTWQIIIMILGVGYSMTNRHHHRDGDILKLSPWNYYLVQRHGWQSSCWVCQCAGCQGPLSYCHTHAPQTSWWRNSPPADICTQNGSTAKLQVLLWCIFSTNIDHMYIDLRSTALKSLTSIDPFCKIFHFLTRLNQRPALITLLSSSSTDLFYVIGYNSVSAKFDKKSIRGSFQWKNRYCTLARAIGLFSRCDLLFMHFFLF